MNIGRFCLLLGAVILICGPSTSHGITLGQVDTFEDSTSQGWSTIITGPPPTGGPGGSSDHYLSVFAAISSGSGRLETFNQSQWTGNYLTAGVTMVELDLRYHVAGPFNDPLLYMRIAINEDRTSPVSAINTGYCSTTAFALPFDGLWHHVSFSLSPADMTAVGTPQPLTVDLANVVDFHIISSFSPSTFGDFETNHDFDVDNIQAVPEPASISILLSGVIGIALLRRRRAQRLK
jgi:hypothetical protein